MDSNHSIKRELLKKMREIRLQGIDEYEIDISKAVNEGLETLSTPDAYIGLNTKGCRFSNNLNGCFICGHLKGNNHPENMYNQFLLDARKYINYDTVVLASNGSFFDPEELDPNIQCAMINHLISLGVKHIKLETRPEFVTEQAISNLLVTIPPDVLEIGLGFDTYTDNIRDLSLNKCFQRKQYDEATEILNEMNLKYETRIVVKPPFLTEKEALNEALISVKHAFNKGSSSISLEPLAIQNYTLQSFLSDKGFYSVPWLWTSISIVEKTHHMGKIVIGGDAFIPVPKKISCNCSKCTPKVRNAIEQFNITQDIHSLKGLDCECKTKWINELGALGQPYHERILHQMELELL